MENGKLGDEEPIITKQDELEIKVEKFFSLIRSYRDARNRLIKIMGKQYSRGDHELLEEEEEIKKNKRMQKMMIVTTVESDQMISSSSCTTGWVPSFESEDFTKELEFKGIPLILPNPCNNEIINIPLQTNSIATNDEPHHGLDLNLTL